MAVLMRTLAMFVLAATACTPEIVSGSYLCGPNASCPEGLVCNGPDHICVSPSLEEGFACEPELETEPDDTPANAHAIPTADCISTPTSLDSCMPEGDTADWVRFVAPVGCSRDVDARVSFAIAFQRLGIELWDLDRNEVIAEDGECTTGGLVGGDEQRCLTAPVVGGTSYGIQVVPAGDGNCDGECAFNRYTIKVQLVLPR
jgi:hypothetical protein